MLQAMEGVYKEGYVEISKGYVEISIRGMLKSAGGMLKSAAHRTRRELNINRTRRELKETLTQTLRAHERACSRSVKMKG